MMGDYDLYLSVHNIAKAVVRQSKGLSALHDFDGDQIKADVDEAARIVEVAKSYWNAMHIAGRAQEHYQAAKTLELDTTEYEQAWDLAKKLEAYWIQKMQDILDSGRYRRNHLGEWIIHER